ncbi:hypothetical protein RSOLAG22IIIB_07437 [Rhizoctonia solani]|uniref:Endonuclease/exonuclease/phosphatase domain-containing protein n=1 Tax=Rhizoctonia solani TaxID=456999 RepID=A0A0K6FN20_9AGAM|nr:hypothetical protein RSOLAG22IIIB_07437 [Rhizoctonia solani]
MLRCSILLLVACSLCSAIPTSQFKRADESSGVFNVLSIGIRDFTMPSIFDFEWEEKSRSAIYIGQRLSQYDYGIVNIQEDFHFHDLLYRLNKHPFRTKDSGKFWYGSGLSTFSKYKWVDFSRTPWNRCGNPYDCFVSRGLTFMRVRIDQGVYIDMINLKLEANAGVEVKDYNARRSNMRQLAEFTDANSAGNAVLVFGDTSSLYTRSIDKAIIHLLTFRAVLMDAWIQAIGGDPLVTGPNITCPQGVPPNISCECQV